MKTHDCKDLIQIFNGCFEIEYNTRLTGGGEEPFYLPVSETQPYNLIIFKEDYFRSALHECAHWFIAGEQRRKKIDYGYWYEPDGRNVQQQAIFQQVEVKPQAVEYLLSKAAKHSFCVSADNLAQSEPDNSAFLEAVLQQAALYKLHGLPPRAEQFRLALINFYH